MSGHKRRLSKCVVKGDVVEVELINSDSVAICDVDDYEKVSQHRWRKNGTGYAVSYFNGSAVGMHRFLANCPDDLEVDHINKDRIDNRKSNLRLSTTRANRILNNRKPSESSGIRGVRKHGKKWQARITVNKKEITLGSFTDLNDAVNARQEAEKKYYQPLFDSMIPVN